MVRTGITVCIPGGTADTLAIAIAFSFQKNRSLSAPCLTSMVSSFEQLARDHQPLDLIGSLVDLNQLCISHELFHRELLNVPISAIDLDRVGGHSHRHIRGEA